jgi:hypothetical protein
MARIEMKPAVVVLSAAAASPEEETRPDALCKRAAAGAESAADGRGWLGERAGEEEHFS